MPELFHMDSGKYGWLILAALYIVFDVVLPMLKKRRQRQQGYTPSPAPVESDLPAASAVPTQRPAAVRQPVRRRRPTPPTAPRVPAPEPPLTRLTLECYTPFLEQPGIAQVAGTHRVTDRIREGTRRVDYPASLDHVHTDVTTALLHAAPHFRADVVAAAGLNSGVAEIRSIEDLVNASDRLAVGWVNTVFTDALGVTLFGPPYARLRMLRLQASGRVHRLAMDARAGQALSLDPPLRIIGQALVDAMEILDMRSLAVEFHSLMQQSGAAKGPIKLELGGMGRTVKFELDSGPAVSATRSMMANMLRFDFPGFDDLALTDLSRHLGTPKRALAADAAVKQLAETRYLPLTGPSRLMALAWLADRLRPETLRQLAGAASTKPRRRATADDGVALQAPTHAALVEAIVLGEILPRRGRG